MTRALRLAVGCAAGLLAAISQVQGAILYDNGGIGPPLATNAPFSQANTGVKVADDFSLSAPGVIRSVTFWGTHWFTGVVPADDTFTATVYSDSGTGIPGALFASSALTLFSRVDTGFDHNGKAEADILEYMMCLVTEIAIPDTDVYWFSIQSTSSTTDTSFAWQEVTGGPGTKAISLNNGATWETTTVPDGEGGDYRDEDVAFHLLDEDLCDTATTVIPEPSSLALFLGLGMIGLAVRTAGRRRRN